MFIICICFITNLTDSMMQERGGAESDGVLVDHESVGGLLHLSHLSAQPLYIKLTVL